MCFYKLLLESLTSSTLIETTVKMQKVCLHLLPFLLSCALSVPIKNTNPSADTKIEDVPLNITYNADAAENVHENKKEQPELTKVMPPKSGITINGNATIQFFITDESHLNTFREVDRAIFNTRMNSQPEIPADYTIFSKRDGFITAYKFQNAKTTWNHARKICAQEGAYLAYPNSVMEESEFHKQMALNKADYIWLGLHDLFEEGDWTSVLGESVPDMSYINWSPREPNNHLMKEHCALLSSKGMNDIMCKQTHAYICKMYIKY